MMNIDWQELRFSYTETDYIVRASFHGKWQDGRLVGEWGAPYATRNKVLPMHVCATALQYGQEAFEGLKVFRGVDGKIRAFRWQANAERMARSAEGLYMAPVPMALYGQMVEMAVKKNKRFLPPYETGATLYLRPLLIGTTPKLGVGPGWDFEFIIIPSPIGPYYKVAHSNRIPCQTFIVNRHVDRAAMFGTGHFKVGGNYASSFRGTEAAHLQGYDCLFLDSRFHRYIDECSAANFIGIKVNPLKEGAGGVEYITPRSSAILPSITNDSLMTLAKERGMKVTRRHIPLGELSAMQEAGACGTACVISPIDKVIDPDKNTVYTLPQAPGPILLSLRNTLQDIQYGRAEDKHHWCTIIN
ncbi:MAG: branched-chain amino acid aminotransferase [Paludibacteraceae bacterium]|nr:branched-chain amino acid aminotransferase [Paludibacteraceae bacterium]